MSPPAVSPTGQPMLAPWGSIAIRKVPPCFGVSAAEVAVVPLVSLLPVDWEVEVPEVCVDGAVVVVDPPPQAASRSVPTTRRLTSRMTESLIERDFIVVLSPLSDAELVLPNQVAGSLPVPFCGPLPRIHCGWTVYCL